MPKERLVLDANVRISGLLWTGHPHQILRLAEEGKHLRALRKYREIQIVTPEMFFKEWGHVHAR